MAPFGTPRDAVGGDVVGPLDEQLPVVHREDLDEPVGVGALAFGPLVPMPRLVNGDVGVLPQ